VPKIDDSFDNTSGMKYLTPLDLMSSYYLFRIAEEDIPKTTFWTSFELYLYEVLTFGLMNALATFQSVMNNMLKPYDGKFLVLYLDDILIFSKTAKEHLFHLCQGVTNVKRKRVSCKPKKV
jgi:hypothetical protein